MFKGEKTLHRLQAFKIKTDHKSLVFVIINIDECFIQIWLIILLDVRFIFITKPVGYYKSCCLLQTRVCQVVGSIHTVCLKTWFRCLEYCFTITVYIALLKTTLIKFLTKLKTIILCFLRLLSKRMFTSYLIQ